ncbi:Sbal_3080 family lipoprotein [Pseudoalteromonas lipolytica]|uniref:Sbal_3080 family lipoprotein n=1 Tax=Pseudoalteromonas lipolytica TaxID=570156 RepID=UPI00241E9B98|nr:Sbal_3080 family lipoprotein [Pseudoalteromonas lipolytica]|tara:strand:- start:1946 stop:2452 length:507 start_codon:yes stop_codon:yes gene_type:complete
MKLLKLSVVTAVATVLAGCAAKQDVSHFEAEVPKTVCIAEHQAVKEGVVTALESGFAKHNVKTRVIPANYVLKHQAYQTDITSANTDGCDAVAFYVANWHWDLALYMAYANIWVMDPEQKETIAQASYRTGGGLDKFIDANDKIIELVDAMFQQVESKNKNKSDKTAI